MDLRPPAATAIRPASSVRAEERDSFAPFGCPMGHGGPAAEQTRSRPRRGYLWPGMIALVFTLGVGAAANFGALDHHTPASLAGPDVATFVAQGIQAERGMAVPPPIVCPPREPVRRGLAFSCSWPHDGARQLVRVTETDSRGQFRFSIAPPRR